MYVMIRGQLFIAFLLVNAQNIMTNVILIDFDGIVLSTLVPSLMTRLSNEWHERIPIDDEKKKTFGTWN